MERIADPENPMPYDSKANDYYGFGKNSIVTLFDSNKKAIGFFEIMNNDKLGKVDVTVKPVKELTLSIPKVTAGVTVTTKGELVLDRNSLPSSVKKTVLW